MPEDEDELPPEPEGWVWSLDEHRTRFEKLLRAEYPQWGKEHRQEFEDTIVSTLEGLYSAENRN